MKCKALLWRTMQICMVALAMCLCSACGEDDPIPTPTPDTPKTGDVSFTVELPGGSGSGTSSSPVVVSSGEKLNMAISQKSSYTDPNGKVYTCEPQATISLAAQLDTVYAKDLTSLTNVKDGSDIKNTTSGTYPVSHRTTQKFIVGGQEIDFDLVHEVFTITNSANETIEMPYVRLNQAKLGNANATEETPKGRAAAAVSCVTVRRLPASRAQTITDSTMYEVNVRFNLSLESVNTQSSNAQTLEFSVNYVGVVETTTTLEDPKADLSYVWDVKSGTNSTASPFIQTGSTPMELWMLQTSTFTDELTNQFTCEPKAKIKISVPQDTVWAASVEDLKKLTETSANVNEASSATQVFTVGGKQLTLDWSYELGQTLEEKNVVMPYYKLSPVELKSVSTQEIEGANTATSEKNIAAYEITATFSQKVTAAGFSGDFVQSFDVEYVVKYIGAVEVSLVDVIYTRDYQWLEASYNLALRSYVTITRERVYSNGKRETDSYRSGNYMVQLMCYSGDPYTSADYLEIPLSDEEKLTFTPYVIQSDDYTLSLAYSKTGVPDLSKVNYSVVDDSYNSVFGPEHWPLYGLEYSEKKFGTDENDREEGWYVKLGAHNRTIGVTYDGFYGPTGLLRTYFINSCHYDLFYYFADTKTVVDFSDMQPKRRYNFTEESAQIAEGSARIFKHECNIEYLGRDFYVAVVDTVYQNK